MDKKENKSVLDRHNRAIAMILKRFGNMVHAAAEPLPKDAILEHAALNRMAMETETTALISEIQALLALNRELKSLWIQGPLREPGGGEDDARRDAETARKARRVYDMVSEVKARIVEQEIRKTQTRAAASDAKETSKKMAEGDIRKDGDGDGDEAMAGK